MYFIARQCDYVQRCKLWNLNLALESDAYMKPDFARGGGVYSLSIYYILFDQVIVIQCGLPGRRVQDHGRILLLIQNMKNLCDLQKLTRIEILKMSKEYMRTIIIIDR
jgi:hypothetical protein